jgi:hypothetical protein
MLTALKNQESLPKPAIAMLSYGGEAALERIKECHNDLVLQRLNARAGDTSANTGFGKHYSVNIKAKIR